MERQVTEEGINNYLEDRTRIMEEVIFSEFDPKKFRQFVMLDRNPDDPFYVLVMNANDEFLRERHKELRTMRKQYYKETGNMKEYRRLRKKYSGR
jgi:hypothetical protein